MTYGKVLAVALSTVFLNAAANAQDISAAKASLATAAQDAGTALTQISFIIANGSKCSKYFQDQPIPDPFSPFKYIKDVFTEQQAKVTADQSGVSSQIAAINATHTSEAKSALNTLLSNYDTDTLKPLSDNDHYMVSAWQADPSYPQCVEETPGDVNSTAEMKSYEAMKANLENFATAVQAAINDL